jgi:hypothetical protein
MMYEPADGGAGFGAVFFLIMLAVYFYFAFTQYKIAQKVGCADKAWWSFVPVLNTFLLIQMAGKDWFWFLFCLIPLVNLIAFAILWMEVAKASGSSSIWGLLVLVPFLNFVAMGVMAFAGSTGASSFPTSGRIDTSKVKPMA